MSVFTDIFVNAAKAALVAELNNLKGQVHSQTGDRVKAAIEAAIASAEGSDKASLHELGQALEKSNLAELLGSYVNSEIDKVLASLIARL